MLNSNVYLNVGGGGNEAFKQLVLLLVAMKFIKLSEFVKDGWVRYSGAGI